LFVAFDPILDASCANQELIYTHFFPKRHQANQIIIFSKIHDFCFKYVPVLLFKNFFHLLRFCNMCLQKPQKKIKDARKKLLRNVIPLQGNLFVFQTKSMFSFRNWYFANPKGYMNV
jgi:hypothetical protein